jgi:3-mercaptopyruvate sulfurtransferase SseA
MTDRTTTAAPLIPRARAAARNYDGSWTAWGSMIGVPIEKG